MIGCNVSGQFLATVVLPLLLLEIGAFLFIRLRRPEYLPHLLLFLAVQIASLLVNYKHVDTHTRFNHFVDYAQALTRGQLFLDFVPRYHDVSEYCGKFFIGFGPLPAVLMIPFVVIYGNQLNDVVFTIVIAALNCALMYEIIIRLTAKNHFLPSDGNGSKSAASALVCALLLGFGSVHFYVGATGTVWHTAQIVTLFFVLLAVNESLGKSRPWLMGLFAALPILSRPSVFAALPFFLLILARDTLFERKSKVFLKRLSQFAAPYFGVAIVQSSLNLARFGNSLDFGFTYMRHAPNLMEDLRTYGQFSLHYLPQNATVVFLKFFTISSQFPWLKVPLIGMGVFLVSPLLLYMVKAIPWHSWKTLFTGHGIQFLREEVVSVGAFLAFVSILLPLLFFFNTGWKQFGYRYSLDFIPFLVILAANGMRHRVTTPAYVLLFLSIAITMYGSIVFIHFPELLI